MFVFKPERNLTSFNVEKLNADWISTMWFMRPQITVQQTALAAEVKCLVIVDLVIRIA